MDIIKVSFNILVGSIQSIRNNILKMDGVAWQHEAISQELLL